MKRIAVLGALVVSGLAAVGVTAQGLPGITEIEQVNGNVYKIWGAGGNTTVFVRENDVVLIDTKLPNSGEAILAEVRKVTDLPIGMIINTHSHPDHMGSNNELSGDSVEVVAHLNSKNRMEAEGGPFGVSEVDTAFSTFMEIGEGDDRIELYHFGAGHTDGDAFVVFPNDRTMAAGDIYAWHMSPLIDPGSGGSMLALPTTLTAAYYGIDGVDHVIQGHGDVSSWEEFGSFVQFNRALVQTAEQTLQFGGDERAALDALDDNPGWAIFLGTEVKPGLEYGGSPKSRALINIMVAFAELRGEEAPLIMGLPREEWPE
ncbi:MBL fold metallo-hydrolase [Alteraurantiacibacter aquimixticola]|nr:MBL fold metallo-hydrolase [Alteraurantiacibacter aquimixticola]